jgi:hypothetical protein
MIGWWNKMAKLIIHETDSHGCGYVHYNGITRGYSYDDGAFGDVRATVHELIEIGFIKAEDVVVFDDNSETDIYQLLNIAIENGLISPQT